MLRVLIADDHAIVRKGLRQLIMEEFPTSEIVEIEDVENLIRQVMKGKWDLVICDISMPGRSGLEALQQIKEIDPDLPVLIISMYPEDQYALRVFKAGASGYLSKDVVHQELIPAIQMIRNGRKFITPGIAEKLLGALNTDKNKEPHETLSNREFDVMKMLAAGRTITEIAEQLSLSATTVSTYRSRILEKTGLRNNADITRYSLERKLI
jgi:two-component system invasion response regulator UvrY